MNNYPKWWDTTVTIFNKYEDSTSHKTTWFKTVVTGCFWKFAGNRVTIDSSTIETKNIICRIPKNSKYLTKLDWSVLTEDELTNFFTLGVGDIVICGEVADVIDEYTAGQRSSDILKKYKQSQQCMTIEAVSDNTGDYLGRPHYYVRGI